MQREPLDLTTPSPSIPMTDSSMDSDQQFNFVSEHNPSTFSLTKPSAGANGTSTRRCQVCNGNSSGYHFGKFECYTRSPSNTENSTKGLHLAVTNQHSCSIDHDLILNSA